MNTEKIEILVERSKQGDTAAFRQLVETCQPFVFRLAFRLLCCEEEAKDIREKEIIIKTVLKDKEAQRVRKEQLSASFISNRKIIKSY